MTQPVAPRWLWLAHGSPPLTKPLPACPGMCAACGNPGEWRATAQLGETFNNWDLLFAPLASSLCTGCGWYFQQRYLRQSHWLVTPAHALKWPREQMRADLLHRLAAPAGHPATCYCVTTSWKKHSHVLLCPPTPAGASQVRVQVEEGTALLDPVAWPQLVAAIDALLALGHRKREIEAGRLNSNSLFRHGRLAEAQRLLAVVLPWLGGPELTLALYATILPEREEAA